MCDAFFFKYFYIPVSYDALLTQKVFIQKEKEGSKRWTKRTQKSGNGPNYARMFGQKWKKGDKVGIYEKNFTLLFLSPISHKISPRMPKHSVRMMPEQNKTEEETELLNKEEKEEEANLGKLQFSLDYDFQQNNVSNRI